MRFSRVLLVNPEHDVEWPGLTPPLGLGYLAEALRNEGIEYDVLDMNLRHSRTQVQKKLESFRPDVVGMTMITRNYRAFYRTLEEIKQHNSSIKIVAGGAHVTILRDRVLEECSAIDYGVVGDGESALGELCKGEVAEKKVRGLIYRDNGCIVCTADREPVAKVDEIPWPRYDRFELERYFKEISIYTSRGCPYRCIFCARHVLSPKYQLEAPGTLETSWSSGTGRAIGSSMSKMTTSTWSRNACTQSATKSNDGGSRDSFYAAQTVSGPIGPTGPCLPGCVK